jgi:phosphoenolpyruvate carboxykinase (GTP)
MTATQTHQATTHQGILDFVNEVAAMTTPDRIHWCTGSDEEWTELTDALVASGTFTRLDPTKKPNSFHCASDPSPGSRTAPSSAPSTRRTPGPPTTGWTRRR